MAGLAVLGELGGGVLLAVGLFTPLAAAAVVGVMVNAASTHWPNGLWSTRGGFEYPMVLGTVGAAIGFMGPGRLSLDRAAGWALAGNGWGAAALLVGVLSAAAALLAKTRQGSDHRSLSRA
jgi:putative oxidoreductase